MRERDHAAPDVGVVVGVVEDLGRAVGAHLVEGVGHGHRRVVGPALDRVEQRAHGVAARGGARVVRGVAERKLVSGLTRSQSTWVSPEKSSLSDEHTFHMRVVSHSTE